MGTRSLARGTRGRRRRGFLATVVALDDDPVLFCECDGDVECSGHATERRHLAPVAN